MDCPRCGDPLVADPKNPGKVLCYSCRKRYDESKVALFEQQQARKKQQDDAAGSVERDNAKQVAQVSQNSQSHLQQQQQPYQAPQRVQSQVADVMPTIEETESYAHANENMLHRQDSDDVIVADALEQTQSSPGNEDSDSLNDYDFLYEPSEPAYAQQPQRPVSPFANNSAYATIDSENETSISTGIGDSAQFASTSHSLKQDGGDEQAFDDKKPSKIKGVLALVLGILALPASVFFPACAALAVVAIVLGIIGIVSASRGRSSFKSGSIIGIVLSVLALGASCAMMVLGISPVSSINVLSGMGFPFGTNTAISTSDGNSTRNGSQSGAGEQLGDDSPWTTLEFSLDGKQYVLGQVTLRDILNDGWQIDSGSATEDEMTARPNQVVTLIQLTKGTQTENYVYVNVLNSAREDASIEDCKVVKISFMDYGGKTTFAIGGVRVGANISELISTFGEPQDQYGEEGTFRSLTYSTSNYSKMMTVSVSTDGKIDEMSLSSLD